MADYTGNAVKFKLGTQASLNTLKDSQKGWEVGTFYLTSDSSRLYIGQADELALLNKSVEIYDDLSALKAKKTVSTKGDIAYCAKENVLAYYNGTTWNQINPDDDTILTALTQAVSSVTDGVKITTGGTNSDPKKSVTPADVTITGAKGAKVAMANSKALTITGDTYALNVKEHADATNDIDLVLDSALQDDSTVHIKGGDNVTITKVADSNGIQIASKDTKLNGIILGLNKDGELQVGASDTAGTTGLLKKQKLGYFVDGSYYGIGSDDETKRVDLPVYSKEQVDALINKLDGMTYRGTIGTSGTTFTMDASFNVLKGGTATDIHIGDMFLVQGGNLTYATGQTAGTGDLLIATAKDKKSETNGVLAIGDVEWTYVPSGDDQQIDTTYIFKAEGATDSMTVTSSNGGGVVGKIAFTAGDGIVIDSTDNGGKAPNQLNVTVKHDTYANGTSSDKNSETNGATFDNKPLTNGGTFDIIDSVTYDNGHITNINTKTIQTLEYKPGPDSASRDEATNTVTVKHTLQAGTNLVSDDNAKMVLKSDTLKLTASGNTVTADLVWGSF